MMAQQKNRVSGTNINSNYLKTILSPSIHYYCIMKKMFLFCLGLGLLSCSVKKTEQPSTPSIPAAVTHLRYAEGFKVSIHGTSKLVEVLYPFQGATSGYKYLLVPQGDTVPEHEAGTRIIFTPLSSIVCTSTTHIPLLDYLNETDKLVGFPTTDYISSEKMRKRIDVGKIQELGVDKGLNLERLAMLKPGMVMGYTMSSDFGQFKKVEELNIPVVINAEYLEKHPLGRAEWIKFMALFFNKETLADSVFNTIEKNYLETKALADNTTKRPTVLSGIVYGDAWFLPGGQNYASKLLKDASCNYLWGNDSTNGYLELSFESVYEKARNADIWIGVGTFKSLEEIKMADHRYTKFKPFKSKEIYTYDARKGAKGGSEFLELGYLRPDIILKDLLKIGHSELLPEYQLFFHRKLN
jgi:iron complex transport system substrate-binding protein